MAGLSPAGLQPCRPLLGGVAPANYSAGTLTRSVRGQFGHTAPPPTRLMERPRVYIYLWLGKWIIIQQVLKPLPIQPRSLAPAVEPFVPGPRCPKNERTQALVIVIFSEVDKMPPYPTDERSVLQGYRLMPVVSAKVIGIFDRPRKALLSVYARHIPARPLVISAPIHRKSKKIKTARTFTAFLI